MRITLLIIGAMAAGFAGAAPTSPTAWAYMPAGTHSPLDASETCFGSGERSDGLNKICFYKCASCNAAITVRSTDICPLTIQR